MKKNGLIIMYSVLTTFILTFIATVMILASSTQSIASKVSIVYVATEIGGSVSATYKVGSSDAKSMTDSDGNTVVSFSSDQPSTVSLLAPKETINLSSTDDVIFTYTFTNIGEQYYASVSYEDADATSPSKNLSIMYQNSTASSGYSESTEVVTVPREGSVTYSIKISIKSIYLNASLDGTISWVLTKEKPKTVDDYVALSVSNNTGSSITSNTFAYETRTTSDGAKQFKIVGATPVVSTSAKNSGDATQRTATSSRETISMTIAELTNSAGAEFYYFCTNSAVVGNSTYGYVDPETIYYTSSDTIENWYDMPTSDIQLYACFMKPNYDGTTFTGTTSMIISNAVTTIPDGDLDNMKNCIDTVTFDSDDIPVLNSVTSIVFPNSVSKIGTASFMGFGTHKILLPSSVQTIGDYAFYMCYDVTDIFLPYGLKSVGIVSLAIFNWALGKDPMNSIVINSLESCDSAGAVFTYAMTDNLYIGDGVTATIEDGNTFGCFFNNIKVSNGNKLYYSEGNCLIEKSSKTLILGCKNSIIPNGVKSIRRYAFSEATGLTSLALPDSVTSIEEDVFSGCTNLASLTIGSGMTSIKPADFKACTGLTSITIASGNATYRSEGNCIIEKSSNTLIFGCKNSKIPSSVTSIGECAFDGCSGLTGITIPSSVTSIGERAFQECTGLTSISIPGSVISVGDYAFQNCSGLTSITIPDSVTSIEDDAFSGCSGLTSITIPDSVTSIGSYAFSGCSGLTSITIGTGVTSIGPGVFSGCSGLTSITIPNRVTSIGYNAFYSCSGLTSITIPSSVTSIGNNAFYNCTNLTNVTFADLSKTWKIEYRVSNYSPTDTSTNATYLKSTYSDYTWTKNS